MYIGDTSSGGLHHLVYEVVDNSIDEAMADFARFVSVVVHTDGSVTVEDDGRGIPVTPHEQLTEELGRDVTTLEGVMTMLKFGGKFKKGAYQTSGGLHGVGVTVVNFLSQWATVEVARDGFTWTQEYERGVPTGPVQKGRATKKKGTKTTFKADGQIFDTLKFNYDTLYKRLQELAFLNSGVHIKFLDERNGESGDFKYERGLVEFVEHLNRASDTLHADVIQIVGEKGWCSVRHRTAVQHRVHRERPVVRQQHSYDGRRHPRVGFPLSADANAERLRQERKPVQEHDSLGR